MTPDNKQTFKSMEYTLATFEQVFPQDALEALQNSFMIRVQEDLSILSGLIDPKKDIKEVTAQIVESALIIVNYWGNGVAQGASKYELLADNWFQYLQSLIPDYFVNSYQVTEKDKHAFTLRIGVPLFSRAAKELKEQAPELRRQLQQHRSKRD